MLVYSIQTLLYLIMVSHGEEWFFKHLIHAVIPNDTGQTENIEVCSQTRQHLAVTVSGSDLWVDLTISKNYSHVSHIHVPR